MTHYEHNETSESAADIFEVIADINRGAPDEYGRGAEGENRANIIRALDAMDLSAQEQSDETIEFNIYNARALVDNGDARRILKEHPYVDMEDLKSRQPEGGTESTLVIDFPKPIIINWARLDGAASFNSWLGRGLNGTGEVAHRGQGPQRTSMEAIFDYATRDTSLPPVDLQLYLTDQQAYLMSENSHTAAAAILRQENLKCKWLRVVDARVKQDSPKY